MHFVRARKDWSELGILTSLRLPRLRYPWPQFCTLISLASINNEQSTSVEIKLPFISLAERVSLWNSHLENWRVTFLQRNFPLFYQDGVLQLNEMVRGWDKAHPWLGANGNFSLLEKCTSQTYPMPWHLRWTKYPRFYPQQWVCPKNSDYETMSKYLLLIIIITTVCTHTKSLQIKFFKN